MTTQTKPEEAPAAAGGEAFLSVRDLKVHFSTEGGVVKAVDGLSFDLARGKTLGIVGESGSGKSVTNLAVLGLHNPNKTAIEGSITLDGQELTSATEKQLEKLRGNKMAMIFQDALTALSPYYTIGRQIGEPFMKHTGASKRDARVRAIDLLQKVGIPHPQKRVDDYPHQFSGGMRQRAMIAMALSCNPDLLIADEPTTALDVTVQAQILDLLKDLQQEFGSAIIMITHDLGVVGNVADDILVMYAGRAVERGTVREVLKSPRHPYTWGLLGSMPRLSSDVDEPLMPIPGSPPSLLNPPSGCAFHPRCAFTELVGGGRCASDRPSIAPGRSSACHLTAEQRQQVFIEKIQPRLSSADTGDWGITMSDTSKTTTAVADTLPRQTGGDGTPLMRVTGLAKYFPVKGGFPIRRTVGHVKAVDGVDFEINAGESLGLVGESGCGKSTTGRLLTRLYEPTRGTIEYKGQDITHVGRSKLAPIRSEIQMIFQDPYASLNPRQTVGTIISGPMEINGINPPGGREKRVRELLEIVGLNPEHYNRFPHEFSGGQRQRIGVARAVALEPKLIIADEPVSALDVSIQAQVVNLLQEVQREMGIAFVFIAHDLAIVRHFSQRVAVMYLGKVVEIADRDSIYNRPRHPYTRALLSAVPEPDIDAQNKQRIRLEGDVPSPISPPSGCRFRTRCWKAQAKCATEEPPLVHLSGSRAGHLTACHFPEAPSAEADAAAGAADIVLDPGLKAAKDTDGGTPTAES